MNKKIVTACFASALAAVTVVGASLAYFTDTDTASNTFTIGNVAIDVVETSTADSEKGIVAGALDEAGNITFSTVEPGIVYSKVPVVKNTGKNSAWLRVNVTVSDWTAFKAAAAAHSITDLATIFGGHDESLWTRCAITENNDNTATYSYYYNDILAADAVTSALFSTVTVPGVFTDAEMASLGDDFTISVSADAIQAEGFDNVVSAFAAFDA